MTWKPPAQVAYQAPMYADGGAGNSASSGGGGGSGCGTDANFAHVVLLHQALGSAAGYGGVSDMVQYPNKSAFSPLAGDFAFEFLFTTNSATGFQAIASFANGSATNANYSWQLLINTSSLVLQAISGTTVYAPTASGVVTGSTVQHGALVRNGSSLTAYLNGTPGTPVSVTGVTFNNPASSVLQIGRSQGSFPLNGTLPALRLTTGIPRYTAAFTPPTCFPTS